MAEQRKAERAANPFMLGGGGGGGGGRARRDDADDDVPVVQLDKVSARVILSRVLCVRKLNSSLLYRMICRAKLASTSKLAASNAW